MQGVYGATAERARVASLRFGRNANHSARDARALAQSRISLLLALEVASTRRATADRDGLDPADERRKSALGRATHSRRTAQAGVRGRAVKRRQVHDQTAWAAKPGMAHLPA